MVDRWLDVQRLAAELARLIGADMPEAQRLMEQGQDWQWHRVTSILEKVAEIEALARGAVAIETGNPSFGMAEGPIGGEHGEA